MQNRIIRVLPALSLCVAMTLAACGERARGATSLAVTDIDLGRSINADLTIGDKTDDFHPADVIYVSIGTKGEGNGTMNARWTFEDNQQVSNETRTVNPTGSARTEFHVSKPGGWPAGKYRVEIMLNGVSAGSKEFEVK